MLTVFAHLNTYMPPACSRHRLSFVYMRLHAHGIHPPQHLYAVCMLMEPPIICSIFCLSNPVLYVPACSRPLPTSPPLSRLHTHGNARTLPLPHRLHIHSTRTHNPTIPQHFTTLPLTRQSTAPTTAAPTVPIMTLSVSSFLDDCHASTHNLLVSTSRTSSSLCTTNG